MLVYPPNKHITESSSTFFIGSAKQSCKINGANIQLNHYGNFSKIQELKLGANLFELEIDGLIYKIEITRKLNTPVNILRYILVSADKLRIPLHFEPEFTINQSSETQLEIDFPGLDFNLDWIYYAQTKNPFIVSLDKNLIIKSNSKILSFEKSWASIYDESYLEIAFELDDQLTATRPKPALKYQQAYTQIKICLDPGHGGALYGALSNKGLKEKDLNLQVAQFLKQELEELGFEVIMTRDSDKDVALAERVKIADDNVSHLFVSLHHNALPDGKDPNAIRGVSVHYYDEASRAVSESVLEHLAIYTGLEAEGIYRQNLHVLRENKHKYAFLVELGYLIHPEESEIISTTEYQINAAKAIAKGIFDYNSTYNLKVYKPYV